jgi:hypothetical protein
MSSHSKPSSNGTLFELHWPDSVSFSFSLFFFHFQLFLAEGKKLFSGMSLIDYYKDLQANLKRKEGTMMLSGKKSEREKKKKRKASEESPRWGFSTLLNTRGDWNGNRLVCILGNYFPSTSFSVSSGD